MSERARFEKLGEWAIREGREIRIYRQTDGRLHLAVEGATVVDIKDISPSVAAEIAAVLLPFDHGTISLEVSNSD